MVLTDTGVRIPHLPPNNQFVGDIVKAEDLYVRIPELKINPVELIAWWENNKDAAYTKNPYHIGGTPSAQMPYHFTQQLNSQVKMDVLTFNYGDNIFYNSWMSALEEEEYGLHVDYRRCTSLNFLLVGAGSTCYWEKDGERIECPYTVGEGMLFNTQVPHAIESHGKGQRLLLSVICRMGFPRLKMLYEKGMLFEAQEFVKHSYSKRIKNKEPT